MTSLKFDKLDKDFLISREEASIILDTSMKNVQHFTMETPDFNEVTGWISKSHKKSMGSMIIEYVNGYKAVQFVTATPKLTYLDHSYEKYVLKYPHALNKEDGTNILMYPLVDHNGNIIEVLFKTRLMPNLNENWQKKVDEVITSNYFEAVKDTGMSFCFELYGTKNHHGVRYDQLEGDLTLRLDLLTIFDYKKSLDIREVRKIAKKYDIPVVFDTLLITKMFDNSSKQGFHWFADVTPEFKARYGKYIRKEYIIAKTLPELYHKMEKFFDMMNLSFQRGTLWHTIDYQMLKIKPKDMINKGIITEGSVWHNYFWDQNYMVKAKPDRVREQHIRRAVGVQADHIYKAIFKAEEHFGDLKEVNGVELMTFIQEELIEEYEKSLVYHPNALNKIRSIIKKRTREIVIDNEMLDEIQKINDAIGANKSLVDKMRYWSSSKLSNNYSSKERKRYSRRLYATMEYLESVR